MSKLLELKGHITSPSRKVRIKLFITLQQLEGGKKMRISKDRDDEEVEYTY